MSNGFYIASRFALQPIQSTAPELQGLLHRYATWLWKHKTAPATVRDHCEDLAAFWYWSIQLGINSPEQVQPSLINDYLLTLYWQWQCSKCQGIVGFEPRHRKPPRICPNCGAVHSLSQVKRYAQNTVRHRRSKLRVFFNWAKSNRLIVINPVQRQVAKPEPTIRHYPPEVIRQLCEYVVAPDAEPVEALVLYLKSARHNMPVGHDYPFQIVQRASLKVLGAACNPSTLRKTTGVMFTDHAGGGILRWIGMARQSSIQL